MRSRSVLLAAALAPLGACAGFAPPQAPPLMLARLDTAVPPVPAELLAPVNGKADAPFQLDVGFVLAERARQSALAVARAEAVRAEAEPTLAVASAPSRPTNIGDRALSLAQSAPTTARPVQVRSDRGLALQPRPPAAPGTSATEVATAPPAAAGPAPSATFARVSTPAPRRAGARTAAAVPRAVDARSQRGVSQVTASRTTALRATPPSYTISPPVRVVRVLGPAAPDRRPSTPTPRLQRARLPGAPLMIRIQDFLARWMPAVLG